jgi:hypothetical protein
MQFKAHAQVIKNEPQKLLSTSEVDAMTKGKLDSTLISKGVSSKALQYMSKESKKYIATHAVTVDSSVVVDKTISNDSTTSATNNSIIHPMDSIPASQLELVINTFRIDANNVTIYFDYFWPGQFQNWEGVYANSSLPFFRGSDPFGVSYDGSKFNQITYAAHRDYYTWGNNNENVACYTNEVNRAADVSNNGIYWDANLRSNFNCDVNQLYGWGIVNLHSDAAYQTCQVYGKYSHQKGSGTVGFAIGFLSLGWAGSSAHDDASVWGNIKVNN